MLDSFRKSYNIKSFNPLGALLGRKQPTTIIPTRKPSQLPQRSTQPTLSNKNKPWSNHDASLKMLANDPNHLPHQTIPENGTDQSSVITLNPHKIWKKWLSPLQRSVTSVSFANYSLSAKVRPFSFVHHQQKHR